MLTIKRNFSKVLVFILAVLISVTCGTFEINSNAFLAEEVEGHTVQYVKGQIVFGSPYSWDNENIQLVATQLPEYSVKPMFESEGVNTYLITLKDVSKNDEAVELLQSVPDTVFALTNYFYANDTDSILQMQESDNYHKGDVDGDGELTSTDYLKVKYAFIGQEGLEKKERSMSDIDNSGEIDGTDYLLIKAHFIGNVVISKDGFFCNKNVSDYKCKIDILNQKSIAEDYLEFRNLSSEYVWANIKISALSGSFNGAYVMKIGIQEVAEFDVTVEKEVGGNLINIPLCADLVVLKDGVFYSIEEAYEQNILSAEEIGIANSIYKTSIATMEPYLA